MSRSPNKPGRTLLLNIAIVGAPGTGKTTLVAALQAESSTATTLPHFLVKEALPLMQAIMDGLQHPHNAAIASALAQHRQYDLTLLLGLDLALPGTARPGQAAAAQQADCDASLRQALSAHGLPYTVVYGSGSARTDSALQAIAHHISSFDAAQRHQARGAATAWQWCCDTCSDAACEHRLFSALVNNASVRA